MRLWGKRAGSAPERMDIAEQIRTDPEGGSRRLVAELGAGLYALALRLCGNRADAEDLYVRTLETAVAKIAEQRGPFFSAWLRAICLNLRRSDLRHARPPDAPPGAADALPGEGPSPLDETAARADAAAVRDAVARLPERLRAPVLLRYWDGLSHAEIASALGVPESSSRRLLSEARAHLRAGLDELLRERRTP